jgi:hypothetical protein
MDIDVIAKHMPGLLEFKKRVEALLEGAEAGSGTAAEALSNQIADLRSALGKIGNDVTALQVLRSGDDKRLADISGLLDGLAGLKDMAEWFAQNREGLEVLLSIGDDLAPKPQPQPQPDPEPPPVVEPVVKPLAPVVEPQAAEPASTPSAPPDPALLPDGNTAPAEAPQPDIAAGPIAAAPVEPAATPAADPTADQPVT